MRWIKVGLAWLVDKAIEHWAQLVFVGGSSIMTYLASATDWLSKYGPVAWGAVGIGTYLLFTLGYLCYGAARKLVYASKYAQGPTPNYTNPGGIPQTLMTNPTFITGPIHLHNYPLPNPGAANPAQGIPIPPTTTGTGAAKDEKK